MSDNNARFIKGSQCPEARIVFPRLTPSGEINPKTGKPDEKRSMLLAWPKGTDLSVIEAAIAAAAAERFGTNVPKFKSALKDADTAEKQSGETYAEATPALAGHMILNVNSYQPVNLVGPNPKDKLDYSQLNSGDYGRAGLSAKWFEVDGNRGVTFYFGNVQKLRDGERIGGGAPAAEDEFGDDVSAKAASKAADAAVDDGFPL